MNVGKVRELLELYGEQVLEVGGIKNGEAHSGTRQVLYKEGQMPLWEFGVAIMLHGDFEKRLEDFDALMAGPNALKDVIEADRSLAGTVVDCDVTSIRGPQRGDNAAITEWIVQIRAEEE